MSTNPPVTWFKILSLLGATVGLCVGISWTLLIAHATRPHTASEELMRQLSGQLGNLSSSNSKTTAVMESLRRDLERNVRAIERLEEKLP